MSEEEMELVKIPAWVAARLRQENPNIAKAIADLVIWSDKAKMWMFQTDAELDRIVEQLEDQQGK